MYQPTQLTATATDIETPRKVKKIYRKSISKETLKAYIHFIFKDEIADIICSSKKPIPTAVELFNKAHITNEKMTLSKARAQIGRWQKVELGNKETMIFKIKPTSRVKSQKFESIHSVIKLNY